MVLLTISVVIILLMVIFKLTNWLSYKLLKDRILKRKKWDLNISCGKTNGGGTNADIVKHADLPNFILLTDIYHLPFKTGQFKTVLCSHTIEHVDDPTAFFSELKRVGQYVTLVIPPLWDITAALNILEHRWVFLTFKKEHTTLPLRVYLPFADFIKKNLLIEYIKA